HRPAVLALLLPMNLAERNALVLRNGEPEDALPFPGPGGAPRGQAPEAPSRCRLIDCDLSMPFVGGEQSPLGRKHRRRVEPQPWQGGTGQPRKTLARFHVEKAVRVFVLQDQPVPGRRKASAVGVRDALLKRADQPVRLEVAQLDVFLAGSGVQLPRGT